MLKKIYQILLIIVLTFIVSKVMILAPVYAADPPPTGDLPSDVVKGIQDTGTKSSLPSYGQGKAHAESSYYSGATEITSAFLYTVDFLKYAVAPLAVFYLIISAVMLITAGYQIDEVITKEKEALKWVFLGLLLIFAADIIVNDVFFGPEGDVLQDTDLAQDYALEGARNIRGFYNLIELFIVSIAVLVMIISGFRLIAQAYDEEATKSAKTHIIWAIVGLIFIGLAELLVQIVFPYFPEEKNYDFFFDVATAKQLIASLTTFAASFITIIAVAAIAYAGYLYVVFFGDDGIVEKAKKIIFGAVIAILLAAGSYALVSTFIPLIAR